MTAIRRRFVSLAAALVLFAAAGAAQAQHRIETYAGGGPDDVAAIAAAIGVPTAVALDASGNMFIASQSSRVFKVDAAGHLTVLAGTGVGGFGGDGGPARDATLFAPTGVAVDASGNVYICDWGNQRIRRVDAVTLEITTVAGGGSDTADGVPAAASALAGPNGVAVDAAGQIYIAETGANRIRTIDAAGTITTIAAGPLNFPMAVAVDAAGNIFIADTGTGQIQKVDASGVVSTAALASSPSGVAIAAGVLYIAEQSGARVLQVSGGITTTFAGTGVPGFSGDGGPAIAAAFSHNILGLAADASGNVVIADSFNRRVRLVDAASNDINSVAGNGQLTFSGEGEPALKASLTVTGLSVDAAGNVYFPDAGRIRRVTAATGVIETLAGSEGIAVEGFGIAPDGAGGWLVADFAGNKVNRIDGSGAITTVAGTGVAGFTGDGSTATAARLNGPTAVAVDAAGNIFIADTFNHRVRKVNSAGTISTVAGNGTTGLGGGSPLGDGGPATSARVWNPTGLALRGGSLYIAEQFGHRVRVVDALGTITTFAGGGSGGDGGPAVNAALGRPTTLTFDALGNLYITETEVTMSRLRRVDTTGTIETIAGTGAPGFSGDGGPATLATFALLSPWGVAVDGVGNVLLGDRFNNRIRRVTNGAPVADAGNDVIATPGIPFTLSGDGSSDPDGDALSYEWLDETGSLVAATREVTLTRGAGTYPFTLTVSDGFTSDTDTVVVSMNPVVFVNIFGTGSGAVTSSDGGISCASGIGGDCAEGYAAGTPVTLTATPQQWSVFGGWGGVGVCAAFATNVCSFTVPSTPFTFVPATFNLQTFTLTVTSAGGGTVTSSVGAINCGAACSDVFIATTPVVLTAAAIPGYRFDGWSGACTGTGVCNLTMTADFAVTATFSSIALTQLVVTPASATIGVGQLQPFKATASFTAGPDRVVSPASALELGDNYSCGLLINGTVKCWASFATPPPSPPAPVTIAGLSDVVSLGAGTSQVCAVLANGTVKCLGSGYLGDGPPTSSTTPVTVSGISTATAVVVGAGNTHACVLLADRTIQCWGPGGLIGDGTGVTSQTPVPVVGITNAVAISSEGGLHTCALLADRTIQCWGASPLGQLGNNGGVGSLTPVAIPEITDATAVAAGSSHTCAIVGSGAVKCWGGNFFGQLGDGTMGQASATPVDVLGITNAVAIATGDFHSCALLADGSVKCWGEAYANGSLSRSGTPSLIAGINDATAIGTGAVHSCAMLVSGGIKCWGLNAAGELGDGTLQASPTPVAVAGITTGLSVVWTSSHIFARVDAHGRAVGAASGTTTIGVAAAGASAAATLSVDNTPAGSNVIVSPIDVATGSAPATLTFSSVTQTGATSLVMTGGGPAPPAGFQLGNPPTYYELTTTAVFSGFITVCIDYSGISFSSAPALYHFESGIWVDHTTSVDLVNEVVCGVVTSLSPFALFQQDAAPVIREVRPDPRELWPANHRLVTVTIGIEASDDSGVVPVCRIAGVASSEPVNGQGDGDTSPDWLITGDLTVKLRAERSGRGSGRVYSVAIRCTDAAGNATTAAASVLVPHDRRR